MVGEGVEVDWIETLESEIVVQLPRLMSDRIESVSDVCLHLSGMFRFGRFGVFWGFGPFRLPMVEPRSRRAGEETIVLKRTFLYRGSF